jgi:hypothetical protein
MKRIIILFLCLMINIEIYSAENVRDTSKKAKLANFYTVSVGEQGEKIWHCDVSGCGRNIRSSRSLHTHLKKFHRDEVYIPGASIKSLSTKIKDAQRAKIRVVCEFCCRELSKGSLIRHLRVYHDIYQEWACRIEGCAEKFKKIVERSEHEKYIHSKDINSLLQPNLNKESIAGFLGIYAKWDATEKTLITRSQYELLTSSLWKNNTKLKKSKRECSKSEYEKSLMRYFAQSYKEGSKLFQKGKVKNLLDIYRKISKPSGDFKQSIDRTKILVVEENMRIKIRREDKDIIEDIVENLSSQYEDGLSYYDTKETLRHAFKKASGEYYQKKFDEKMAELGLDEDRELTPAENTLFREQSRFFKDAKKALRNLFNQIPLHDRDRGYALKDATYKIVD